MADVIPISKATSPGPALSAEPSDDDLMLLARAGAAGAFDMLVRRHQARVLRLAYKYLGDAGLARDVGQNTFIEVFKFLPRYRPLGTFRVFLHRIALNQCHMLRRAARSREQSVATLARQSTDAQAPGLDERLIDRERQREVERALLELSEKLRAVLVLRFAGEHSLEEIGRVLDLPVGTVKSRLFAGLAKLRAELETEELP